MLRRLILKWLFKYPMPEYYHAIQYMKHIKWDTQDSTHTVTLFKHITDDVTLLHVTWKSGGTKPYWYFTSQNEQSEFLTDYADMIQRLDNVLRYGVIKLQ